MSFFLPLFWALAIVLGAVGLIAMAVLAVVAWIALGEPDVNGDPERDSGWTDDDIAAASASWDHGSYRTRCIPDLETARQLNRLHLQREAESIRALDYHLNQIHPHA